MKEIPGLLYHSPYRFSLKQRLVLRIAPPVISLSMKAIMGTCKKDLRHFEFHDGVIARHGHGILAFWHESLAMAVYVFRNTGYHTLTSYSFDGEMAARVVRWFGDFAVRGSSSRGGSEGLKNLQAALNHVPYVGITLDGPKGPPRVSKPGAAVLSARMGVPVVPVAFAAVPAWRMNSWDRMPIPKPFARVVVECGEPIDPPPDESPEKVEQLRARMEQALNDLHDKIDQSLKA